MMGKTAYGKTLKYKNYVLTGIIKEGVHTPAHPENRPLKICTFRPIIRKTEGKPNELFF